jgi:molecular chaperone DnaK (HSP70)
MSIKKTLILSAATLTVAAGTLLGIGMAQADETDLADARPSLVQRIAEKFNLNQDEVQVVFDEFKGERQAEHRAKLEERLQKAVDEGKLTAEQRDAMLAKMDEMKNFMESLKDKTPEERKDALEQKHAELKKWAEDNDIPEGFRMFFGPHGKPGHRGPQGHGPMGPSGDAPDFVGHELDEAPQS